MSNKLNFTFDRDFTVVPNILLKDKRLSYKAKGIFLQIISVPENWNFSVKGLTQLAKESTGAVTSGLRELEACGYLEWTKSRTAFNKFTVEVNVFLPEPSSVLPQAVLPYGISPHGETVDNKEFKNKSILQDEKIVPIGVEWHSKSDVWQEVQEEGNYVTWK